MNRRFPLMFIAALLSTPTLAAEGGFDACADFFVKGRPPVIATAAPVPGALRALCFSDHAILHSGEAKAPVYAVARLNRARIEAGKDLVRQDRFYEEARLPRAERARLADYQDGPNGYDRGHLAPAKDFGTPEGLAQSFSLANIVPQDAVHNRKLWRKIEIDVRKFVLRTPGDVFVYTGAHYGDDRTTASGNVRVPSHLYKLVVHPASGKAFAFWSENTRDAKMAPPISYEALVARTGIRFLGGQTLARN